MTYLYLEKSDFDSIDPKDYIVSTSNCDDILTLDGQEVIDLVNETKDERGGKEIDNLWDALYLYLAEISGNSLSMLLLKDGKLNKCFIK